MKRIFALLISLVVIMAFATVTFADTNGFYGSPSANQAPTIDSVEQDKDCKATLVVTSYADRAQLPEEAQQSLANAYNSIVNAASLLSLNAGLANMAQVMGVTAADLAVRDLFDISYSEDGDHSGHGALTATLNCEDLENFVAILYFENGQWTAVADAEAVNNKLTFAVDTFAPYAIVVSTVPVTVETDAATGSDTEAETEAPKKKKGCRSAITTGVTVAVLAAAAAAATLSKKDDQDA